MDIVSMAKKSNNLSSATTLGEDIVWEVLVRLPTKSLMRLKIVSRLWNSIINNPNFAKEHTLHGGAFRGLLIIDNFSLEAVPTGPRHFFYVDIHSDTNKSPHRWLDHQLKVGSQANAIVTTKVVKGLIGLYECGVDRFTLCNIATHELLDLPCSTTTTPSDPTCTHRYLYHLGFDPIQEVFKVLKTYFVYENNMERFVGIKSEIISLGGGGGGGWRVIDPPPSVIANRSLWINGAFYWKSPKRLNEGVELLMFHLETETFQIVPIAIPDYGYWCHDGLARIDDSPVLVNRGCGEFSMDLWMVKDSYTGIALSEATWIKHVIHLPWGRRSDDVNGDFYFNAGMLPTGQIILAQLVDLLEYEYPVPFNVYCYDHIKKKKSLLITIDDVNPSSPFQYDILNSHCMDGCYFEENIIRLSSLAIGDTRSIIGAGTNNVVGGNVAEQPARKQQQAHDLATTDREQGKQQQQ